MPTDPVLVVGSGAIGAIVGVHLIEAGHEVHFVDANEDHVRASRDQGLRLSGLNDRRVTAPFMLPGEIDRRYPLVLLAVKARHTEDALPTVAAALAEDGCVVSLQNGLEEYKIARAVGAKRTIGAYLTFGGFYVEPGHVKHGGNGSFKVGEIDGAMSERIGQLAGLLSALQPVQATDNIFGYLWAKIALGAVYFGTAVVDADVVETYGSDAARDVLGRLCGEVVQVADAMGVTVEESDGFDPKAFRPGALDATGIEASWDAQRAYWSGHDNARTGVWRDLAIHGRPTEVDYQIKPVIDLAAERGIPVPHLRRLHATVRSIEREEAPLSLEALLRIR